MQKVARIPCSFAYRHIELYVTEGSLLFIDLKEVALHLHLSRETVNQKLKTFSGSESFSKQFEDSMTGVIVNAIPLDCFFRLIASLAQEKDVTAIDLEAYLMYLSCDSIYSKTHLARQVAVSELKA